MILNDFDTTPIKKSLSVSLLVEMEMFFDSIVSRVSSLFYFTNYLKK